MLLLLLFVSSCGAICGVWVWHFQVILTFVLRFLYHATLIQKIAVECLSVRLSVRLSVLQRIVFTLCWEHFLTNFVQTCYGSWYWVNLAKTYRVKALDWRYKLVFTLYLWHSFTDFLQTWFESRYWKVLSCGRVCCMPAALLLPNMDVTWTISVNFCAHMKLKLKWLSGMKRYFNMQNLFGRFCKKY